VPGNNGEKLNHALEVLGSGVRDDVLVSLVQQFQHLIRSIEDQGISSINVL
jgi:hypothetical protein